MIKTRQAHDKRGMRPLVGRGMLTDSGN